MNARDRFLKDLRNFEKDPAFLAERLVLEINEEICRLMEDRKVTRAELARQMKVSRQFITRILNGNPNLTLLTLVKIATALGARVKGIGILEVSEALARGESNVIGEEGYPRTSEGVGKATPRPKFSDENAPITGRIPTSFVREPATTRYRIPNRKKVPRKTVRKSTAHRQRTLPR